MKNTEEVLERISALKTNHDFASRNRWRIRAIADGGTPAVRALLGNKIGDLNPEDLPWVNLMLSGLNRLAQKIGHLPDPRVDTPATNDTERVRKRAEKRERVVESFDEFDRMELQLPQMGRWIPGYGFGVWTIDSRLSPEGIPYPHASLRDPFDCYPGEWGIEQQPLELAISRIISPEGARRLYPNAASDIPNYGLHQRQTGGAVLLGSGQSGWANQTGRGIEIVEYYDTDGCYTVLPALRKTVDYHENPLSSGPAFVVPKRFAFNALIGQYDHMLGLLAAIAKLTILQYIGMEDAVFSPTVIVGNYDPENWKIGRFDVNVLPPGSTVEKPQSNIPYQSFEIVNRLERMARVVAGYPIQDDAQSPTSWTTGEGLQQLETGITAEVKEYFKVFRYALQDLDSKRLEWDERVSPDRTKPLACIRPGVPHSETYTPRKDIAGDYRTRRHYPIMAGWDDPAVIVGGTQLVGAEVLDVVTFQENIDGIDNSRISQINERILTKKLQDSLNAALVAQAQNGDAKAAMVIMEQLPESAMKTALMKYYAPEEEVAASETAVATPDGVPPDITTVMGQINLQGAPRGGIQTVARV